MEPRNWDYTYVGARPIVCLKSDVELEKQANGTYKIVEDAGEAGIGVNETSLKYVWRKLSEGTPTVEEITETFVIEGTSTTIDEQTLKTIQVQRPITKDTDSGDDWVLWIYAEDTLGNSEIISSGKFWLDNTNPTVEVNPSTIASANVVKNTDVTITTTDTHSGLDDTNNSYQYYLSTSDSALTSESTGSVFGVPQSLTTFTLGEANENGERTALINIGSTETGTRYLFVKAVKDNVGNESITGGTIVEIGGINYHRFGPYEFDNATPKTTSFNPSENTTPAQSQSVVVTIEDQGLAGLNKETFKYLWIQSAEEPTLDSFDVAYADEVIKHKGTFTNGGTVTIDTETGNDWYLWITAEDNFGHRYVDKAGPYYLDNTKPTITAEPAENPENGENQNVVKNLNVTLTYADPIYGTEGQLAGISDNNTYEYYLSTSNTELTGGNLTIIDPAPTGDAYTKTATINIGSGETGIRYLFIRTIFDNAGNESGDTLETYNGANYQLVGTYIFDNTSPKVDFDPNGNSWSKEHSTVVTVREEVIDNVDYGVALVDASTLKYLWIELSEKDTALTEEKFTEQYNSDSITHKGTFATGDEISLDIETGNWYLWILAKDNLGNTTVISSETFYIDNTAPTVGTVALEHTLDNNQTVNYDTDTWTKHDVTITLTDGYDGEGESGHNNTIYNITGTYKNANGEYVEYVDARADKSTTVTLTETGEYEVRVTTTDNVGNSTTTQEGTYIIKIDKENPIVGTLTMTYEGTANVYNKEVLTNQSVNIVLNNGSDETYPGDGSTGESGHKRTTYAIYYMSVNNSNEMDITKGSLYEGGSEEDPSRRTGPITISNTGRYIIVVTTEDMSGDHYSEDGNITIDQTSYVVVIDKDLPTITASPELTTNSTQNANNYVTSQDVTLVVGEVGVGLDNDNNDEYEYDDNFINAYEYALVLDEEEDYITLSEVTNASWTEYTSGTPFTIGQDLTGTYYLVVKTVRDKAGNISSEYGDSDTIDGYHVFGPYKFDNTAPTITTSYSSSEHTEYKQFHIPTVTVVDNNTAVAPDVESGVDNAEEGDLHVDETTLKYVWVNEDSLSDDEKVLSEDAFTREWEKAVTHEETADVATGRYVSGLKGTFTDITDYAISSPEDNGTQQITGDNWYIWVIAKDNLENTQVVKAGPFNLDNTRPTVDTEANPSKETITAEGTKVWTNADVTITVKETNAGLDDTYNNSNSLYQYYVSTSSDSLTYETADSRYGVEQSLTNYTLSAANANGERTATINIGSTETGTRYLFIKAVHDAVADADGSNNVSIEKINDKLEGSYGTLVEIEGTYYHRFGPYEFDNLSPTGGNDGEISFNPTTNTSWEQYQSVAVTIRDQGQAGLDNGEELDTSETTTLKYLWNQSATQPTDFDSEYESATHKGTFNNGETLTLKDVNGNDWYLWISAYDNLNHRFIDGAGPFYLDNTLPEIAVDKEVNPENGENQNVVKNLSLTLTFSDPLYNGTSMAGLRDGEDSGYTYEYYLSTSTTELTGGTLTQMNPTGTQDQKTTTINIGSGETGVRYLFVRTIYDEAIDQSGNYNESEELNNNDTWVTDDGKHYQLVGTYIFDNTAPVVSFDPNGETTIWKLEQTTDVTVQDNERIATSGGISSGDTTAITTAGTGVAGVKTSTVKYRWVQGTSTVLTTNTFANGEERAYTSVNDVVETITETISSTEPDETELTLRKTGDNWYLWIYAEDNLGNASVTRTTNPFKIDNTLPTISVSPESAEVCKSTDITIVAADLASGLNSSNEYVAYLSTTSTDLIDAIDVSDDYRNSINEPITIGAGITGWRYLFVKTVKDNVELESEQSGTIVKATDGNNYHVYGPYIFDNTAPSVEFDPDGNPTWSKSHTTTVTINENPYTQDAATETAGEAGINKSALKYVWRKASQGTPTVEEITETLVVDGTYTQLTDTTKGTTIQIQRPITKDTDSDDDWVLWVYVEDTLGNSNIVSSKEFWLDNTNPTVEATATPVITTDANVWTQANVEIAITDIHSRLNDTTNSYQYYLSTSSDGLTSEAEDSIYGVPQSLKTYSLQQENDTDVRTALINIGSTETGTRYLFIKAVQDNMGNESIEGGTIVEIDGRNYHRFGPYEFDNLSPVVTFEPETNTTYEQEQSSKVTLTERGLADFNTSTFKYLWTTTATVPTAESFDTEYETATYKGTFENSGTVSMNTETGNNWYLWISAEDKLGNRLVEGTETFWLDNTKPTVDVTNIEAESETNNGVWQKADITVTVTEEHAKLASDTLYYYLSTSEENLTSEKENSPYGEPQTLKGITLGDENSIFERTATISELGWNYDETTGEELTHETGLRYLFVKAEEDNAGNISSEYGTLVTITDGEYAGTYHRFGPYMFDNAPPQVVFDPDGSPILDEDTGTREWAQGYNIELTITEIGAAGLDINSFRYIWVENSVTPPDISEFTNSFTAEETTTSDEGIVTTAIAHLNTPAGQTGGNWTLWVLVRDALGEPNVATSEIFQLDNATPVMTITTGDKPSINEVCTSTDVTIAFNETHSGLDNDNNSYEYFLSTSKTALEKGEWLPYTNGTTIQNLGAGITGRRYLFVKTVKDKAGNESNLSVSSNSKNIDSTTGQIVTGTPDSQEIEANSGTTVTIGGVEYHGFGEIVTIDGINYHVFGEFIFDNASPSVQYDLDGNTNWRQSHSTTVTITENRQGVTTTEESGNVLTANKITAEDYGGYVNNYQASVLKDTGDEVKWRIYHSDGENIYLVADRNVNVQYAPAGKNGTMPTINTTNNCIGFTNVINDYKGSTDITNSNNPAKKWLSMYTYESTAQNLKATAYLMDTTAWKGFTDGNYAQYAIGAETLELFAASYNTTHPDKTVDIETNNVGYKIKSSDSENYQFKNGGWVVDGLNNDGNNLYKADWIASPSAGNREHMLAAYKWDWNYANGTASIRPVICLKSEFGLQKQVDGTYKIVAKDPGEAGIDLGENKETIRYLWRQASEGKPTVSEMTTIGERFFEEGVTTEEKEGTKTIKIQRTLTKDTVTGDDWVLWIYVKDTLGNEDIITSQPFYLDNTKPTITAQNVYPTNKNYNSNGQIITTYADVTLIVADSNAGPEPETDPATIYQYYLSTSSEDIEGSEWVTYQSGETFRIGEGMTDTRYLFVRKILDNAGNPSAWEEDGVLYGEDGEITKVGTELYHLMGTYVFDNIAPEVTFNPTGEPEWAKSHSTTVQVRDDNTKDPQTGLAGISTASLKYQWVTGDEVPTEAAFKDKFTNGQTIARALGTGNNWKLWILAKDNVGNTTIVKSDEFWLDNTKPIMDSMISKPSSENTYTLTMSGIRDTDGITPQSEVKGYYISTNATAPTETSEWIEITDPTVEITSTDENGMNTYTVTYEGALESKTYYFWTIDNVGNISEVTKLTTKQIYFALNDSSWYETFAEAVAEASTESTNTIKVLKNVTDLTDGKIDKNVILDTNGKKFTRQDLIEVAEGFSLEVIGTGTITSNSTTEPTIKSNGTLKITSGTITNTAYQAAIENVSGTTEIAGGTVEGNIYVGNGTVDLVSGTVNGNVHGGLTQGTAETSNIILEGATVTGDIYGGGDATDKVNEVNITLISGTVRGVYGGGLNNSEVGTVNIVLNGDVAIETQTIYGGANVAGTVENANIDIKSGTLVNVYGGGTQGGTTLNTTVTIEAGATITGNVYGGAHKATVGNNTDNSGSTTINIVGGIIEGNVYGGSDTDPVYGTTTINIGKDAVEDSTLTSGEITILGDIFGGGHQDKTLVEDEEDTETEEGEEEEEVKDFTEVSVTNGTHIDIDANGTTLNFDGNIFGSGERVTYEGDSNITIKNLGASGDPYLLNSIQRTGTLTIDNSDLEIVGISDSANANVDASYTLNRIGELNIQNGTYLYLRRGFNLVEGLNSLAADGSKAQVTIDETNGTVTSKNVDNRIYVYEGVNLFIAKEEYSKTTAISKYGKVTGMTYFGMYTRERSGEYSLEYDVYDPENPTFKDTFVLNSYVEGLYDENQAIKVDGFYTNALKDEENASSGIITKYVTVITNAPIYQDWMLGDEKVYTQEVTLVAQRNKERVYQSIPLDYLTQEGAEYEVKLFSVNSLEPDINLVSRTAVTRVATTTEIANTTFALIMKNGSGWQNSGETQFYSSGNQINGTTVYLSDDSEETVPYLDFFLYNSINITESKDCGYANIVLEVTKTTNGDASQGEKFKIAISVNIQTIGELIEGEFKTDARITAGTDFGLITENEIFITDRSSMTNFYQMYPLGTIEDDDYRVLSSTCKLPAGTQITMVDYGEDENYPKVYYYEVKEDDGIYEEEMNSYVYNFSDFILMSSLTQGENVTEEEAAAAHYTNNNAAYQASGFEEYKIVIDFKNATIEEDLLQQNIRFELRDKDGYMKNYEILPTQFNVYADKRSELTLNVTPDDSNVYDMIDNGELGFTIKSIMTTQSVAISSTITDSNGNIAEDTVSYPIEDTYFEDKKLGMAISLYDSEGNKVPYEKVKGIYFVVDGKEYYPDLTGTTRWYLADNVVTVEKAVKMYIEGGLLDSGTYTIVVENFASDNGTYYGSVGDNVYDDKIITMIDLTHGLDVEIADGDRVIDSETGTTYDGGTTMDIDVTTSDVVEDTNIRVTLYKRDITYNEEDDGSLSYAGISYTPVDLASYVSNELIKPADVSLTGSNSFEYIVTNSVEEQTIVDFILNLNSGLLTGGYKLEFSIYSGDNCLGTLDRHFVVTDLVTVTEE